MTRSPVRLVAATAAGALLLSALNAPPVSADGYTHSATYIASADGTPLHTEVFRPDGVRGRVPVVLLVSPYLNGDTPLAPHQQPGRLGSPVFEELLDAGYAIVQVNVRGYGASGGCGDFGGRGEQADAKAAVEWAASRPWSTGRVGMWGISYDGWTQVMALAGQPRGLAAAIIMSPLVSVYRAQYMNRAHYTDGWRSTPVTYAKFELNPPAPWNGVEGVRNAATGTATNPGCYAANFTEMQNPDPGTAYWRERDLVERAAASRVPVLWSHGFRDEITKPDHLQALYPRLRGPKRAWVGQFPHRRPFDDNHPEVAERFVEEAVRWLDAYVKRDPRALREVAAQPPAVVQQGDDGRWRPDDAWPPRDAVRASFALRSGTYLDVPGNDGSQAHEQGGVLWSVSRPLPYDVHLSGAPRVSLQATGAAPVQVVTKVYDVDPDGQARVVTRGAHGFVAGRVAYDLFPQDWRFRKGHRIAVAVLGNDYNFFQTLAGGQVQVSGATLAFPALRYDRSAGPRLYEGLAEPSLQFTLAPGIVAASTAAFRLPPKMLRKRPARRP